MTNDGEDAHGRARAVLGVDAAWGERNPSGVALVVERAGGWAAVAVAPSDATFLALASGTPVDWSAPTIPGGPCDAGALLDAARRLAPDAEVVVAALDLPLARGPIAGRRRADDAISTAFGARWCGTHTPSAAAAAASARVHGSFTGRGFTLATADGRPHRRALLEVYPHVALLALLGAERRVEYKAASAGKYWPDLSPAARRARLLREWRRIRAALAANVVGVDLPLPEEPPTPSRMKRWEDALDAVICAWVGIEFLAGRATAYGDATAAIWTPG